MRDNPKRPCTSVYFIRAGHDGPVKIGMAVNVSSRVATLQAAATEKLKVIRILPGGRRVEAWLHTQFHHLALRGEWFCFDPTMMTIQPSRETIDDDLNGVLLKNPSMTEMRISRWIREVAYPGIEPQCRFAEDFGLSLANASRILKCGRVTVQLLDKLERKWGNEFIYYIFGWIRNPENRPQCTMDVVDFLEAKASALRADLTASIAARAT